MYEKVRLTREEQLNTLISCIVTCLRFSFGKLEDIQERVDKLKELCEELGRTDLIEQLDEDYLISMEYFDGIWRYDGRWFDDKWNGPSGCTDDYEHLKRIIDDDLMANFSESLLNWCR